MFVCLRFQKNKDSLKAPSPESNRTMLIESDEDHVQWVKRKNAELFGPGQDEKKILQDYVNEVLDAHRKSWAGDETDEALARGATKHIRDNERKPNENRYRNSLIYISIS